MMRKMEKILKIQCGELYISLPVKEENEAEIIDKTLKFALDIIDMLKKQSLPVKGVL